LAITIAITAADADPLEGVATAVGKPPRTSLIHSSLTNGRLE
jgi:hypothetical protein